MSSKYHTYSGNMAEADRNKRIGDIFISSDSPKFIIAKHYYETAESLYSDAALIASLYGEKKLKETALSKMYGCANLVKDCNRQINSVSVK